MRCNPPYDGLLRRRTLRSTSKKSIPTLFRVPPLVPVTESTFFLLLRISSGSKSTTQLTQLHSLSFRLGFARYTRIQNGLLQGYCSFGRLGDAHRLLDEMSHPDTVSFNSIIHGYAKSGYMVAAQRLFQQVPSPTPVTWTSMIVGFSNAGDVASARQLFDKMPERDLVSWNAMISGYVQNGVPLAALHLFCQVLHERFRPNRVTMVGVLSACGRIGALDEGKWVHAYIHKSRLQIDPFLGTALVDMYLKCGSVDFALDTFWNLDEKNTCSWNAMINGLATNGHSDMALDVFHQMLQSLITPDQVTFVGVLLACSHGGFIEQGRQHFYFTMKKYEVGRVIEHYACMVDLLGRSGHLKEAEELIKEMPIKPDIVVWRALLGGSRLCRNVELAERVMSEMDAHESGDYVLLSNLYASVGRWKDVEKVRKIIKAKGLERVPGCSSIGIGDEMHECSSCDNSHPRHPGSWEADRGPKRDEPRRILLDGAQFIAGPSGAGRPALISLPPP